MIPFVREFDFEYGVVEQVSPLIRRVIANNPGPFTFTGTGVYIIGTGTVAVIDPGPDMDEHWDALMRTLDGEVVSHVFVTHGHLDHSPLARRLAAHFDAKVYASPKAPIPTDSDARLEAGDDLNFRPDIAIKSGDTFTGPGWRIEAIDTPGHTSGHVCFALLQENALFSGDHIMGWSTSVISPPDGDMADYITSLQTILDRKFSTLWPTHGPPITQPEPFITAYIQHRLDREKSILAAIADGHHTIPSMVKHIYSDIDRGLHPAAAHSVLAHIMKLLAEKQITTDNDDVSISGHYRIAAVGAATE